MRALISGISGQDGSYLAELLLDEGFEVHGTVRRSSTPNCERIEHIKDKIHLHYADMSDALSLHEALREAKPDYVYNLAAQSDVRVSYDVPEYSANITGVGALRLLEAVRQTCPEARFYQAGSSEMFGMNPDIPCNEESTFMPGSPYAAAKVFAYHAVRNYRHAYGMHASNGVLFNHESERRGVEFVTRKITLGIRDIVEGKIDKIKLGNLSAKRDWGYAPDYVEAMYLMTAAPEADDYVVATGETYSVIDFLERAFAVTGLDWRDHVEVESSLFRPEDPPVLLGNPAKIMSELQWKPTVTFDELVEKMVRADLPQEMFA